MRSALARIQRTFEREFWPIRGRFDVLTLRKSEDWGRSDPWVYRPGVYVWIEGDEILKVGRHFVNAHKRAFEHIQDDTGGVMAGLDERDDAVLVLFTAPEADRHWIAALEVFLETAFRGDLKVRSKRLG